MNKDFWIVDPSDATRSQSENGASRSGMPKRQKLFWLAVFLSGLVGIAGGLHYALNL